MRQVTFNHSHFLPILKEFGTAGIYIEKFQQLPTQIFHRNSLILKKKSNKHKNRWNSQTSRRVKHFFKHPDVPNASKSRSHIVMNRFMKSSTSQLMHITRTVHNSLKHYLLKYAWHNESSLSQTLVPKITNESSKSTTLAFVCKGKVNKICALLRNQVTLQIFRYYHASAF